MQHWWIKLSNFYTYENFIISWCHVLVLQCQNSLLEDFKNSKQALHIPVRLIFILLFIIQGSEVCNLSKCVESYQQYYWKIVCVLKLDKMLCFIFMIQGNGQIEISDIILSSYNMDKNNRTDFFNFKPLFIQTSFDRLWMKLFKFWLLRFFWIALGFLKSYRTPF